MLRGGNEQLLHSIQDTADDLCFLALSVDELRSRVHLARETMSQRDILGSPAAHHVRQTFATTAQHVAFLADAVNGGGSSVGSGRGAPHMSAQTLENIRPCSGQAKHGGRRRRGKRLSSTTSKPVANARLGLCAAVWIDEDGLEQRCLRSASFGNHITRRAEYCKRHTPSSFVCEPTLHPNLPGPPPSCVSCRHWLS